MKISIKTILTVSISIMASASFASTISKITVNGMVCAFCAQGIEKRLSMLPATKAVFVNLKQKTVAVEAKDGMTVDDIKMKAEIVDAGYEVVKIETLNSTLADIKAQLKAGVKK